MPRALQATSGWVIAVAFGGGGLAYVGLHEVVERLQKKRSAGDDRTSMWMIYIAVAVDLFSDGLMIGAGSAVATSLALILALVHRGVQKIHPFSALALPESRKHGICRQRDA
ncbi:MAG: hypothetical protein ACREJ5_05525 [Geminicoccaceae bacterium]